MKSIFLVLSGMFSGSSKLNDTELEKVRETVKKRWYRSWCKNSRGV